MFTEVSTLTSTIYITPVKWIIVIVGAYKKPTGWCVQNIITYHLENKSYLLFVSFILQVSDNIYQLASITFKFKYTAK